MTYLRSLTDLKAAPEFSRTYLWDIKFPTFNGGSWFPAVDVEENLATVNSHEVPMFMSTYKMPLGSSAFDLKITFMEFGDHSITEWLKEWMNNTILNGGLFVATLEEAVRDVHILKLNHDRTVIKETVYSVFPEGALHFHGSSESAVEMISQDFVIVGR